MNKTISKLVFICIMPIYWAIIFKIFLGTINPALFTFVCCASILMSLTSKGWGVLDNLAI